MSVLGRGKERTQIARRISCIFPFFLSLVWQISAESVCVFLFEHILVLTWDNYELLLNLSSSPWGGELLLFYDLIYHRVISIILYKLWYYSIFKGQVKGGYSRLKIYILFVKIN